MTSTKFTLGHLTLLERLRTPRSPCLDPVRNIVSLKSGIRETRGPRRETDVDGGSPHPECHVTHTTTKTKTNKGKRRGIRKVDIVFTRQTKMDPYYSGE